jgi:hypothetical protein
VANTIAIFNQQINIKLKYVYHFSMLCCCFIEFVCLRYREMLVCDDQALLQDEFEVLVSVLF